MSVDIHFKQQTDETCTEKRETKPFLYEVYVLIRLHFKPLRGLILTIQGSFFFFQKDISRNQYL